MLSALEVLQSANFYVALGSLLLGALLVKIFQALETRRLPKVECAYAVNANAAPGAGGYTAPSPGSSLCARASPVERSDIVASYLNQAPENSRVQALAASFADSTVKPGCSTAGSECDIKLQHASCTPVEALIGGDVHESFLPFPPTSAALREARTGVINLPDAEVGNLECTIQAEQQAGVCIGQPSATENASVVGEVGATLDEASSSKNPGDTSRPLPSPLNPDAPSFTAPRLATQSFPLIDNVSVFDDDHSAYGGRHDMVSTTGLGFRSSHASSFHGYTSGVIPHDSVTSYQRPGFDKLSKPAGSKSGGKSKAATMIKDAKNLLKKSFTLGTVKEEVPKMMISGKDGDRRASASVFRNNKISPTPVMYAMVHPKPAPKCGSLSTLQANTEPTRHFAMSSSFRSKMPGLPRLQVEESSKFDTAEALIAECSPFELWKQTQPPVQEALSTLRNYSAAALGGDGNCKNMKSPWEHMAPLTDFDMQLAAHYVKQFGHQGSDPLSGHDSLVDELGLPKALSLTPSHEISDCPGVAYTRLPPYHQVDFGPFAAPAPSPVGLPQQRNFDPDGSYGPEGASASSGKVLSRGSSESMDDLLGQAAAIVARLADDGEYMDVEEPRLRPMPATTNTSYVEPTASHQSAHQYMVPSMPTPHDHDNLCTLPNTDERKLQAISSVNWSSASVARATPAQVLSPPKGSNMLPPVHGAGQDVKPKSHAMCKSGKAVKSGKRPGGRAHPAASHHAAAAAAAYATLQSNGDLLIPRSKAPQSIPKVSPRAAPQVGN